MITPRISAPVLALVFAAALIPAAQADEPEAPAPLTLRSAAAMLPVAAEDHSGYVRTKFHHWTDADHDGCPTRAEVLIAEATEPVTTGNHCKITDGSWYSYYDDTHITGDPTHKIDIDHMVPLSESWDSGASAWTPEKREAYANDLGAEASLVAVSAHANRSKSDQDPAQWLPTYEPSRCRYITEWTATKLRWGLTVDEAEHDTLAEYADQCPNVPLTVTQQ